MEQMTEEKQIIKYELSSDKVGLLAYFDTDNYYHIHSDELNPLEKWIHNVLVQKKGM